MTLKIPPSTIAMSAVSLLCRTGPVPRDSLPVLFASRGYPVAATDVDAAVEQAIARGVLKVEGAMLISALPVGWVVVDRDRSGDGWNAWLARSTLGEQRNVNELIEGANV